MITFFVTLFLVAGASGYMGWQSYRSRLLLRKSCAALIDKMYYVKFSEVRFVAGEASRGCSPEHLIDRLGGIEGLTRLRSNAKVMLETAKYLSFVDPEGQDLAEQLRREATELRGLVMMVLLQHRLGLGGVYLAGSVQQLSKLYIAATKNHLGLCDRLIDDVLLLVNHVSSTQTHIMRTGIELMHEV